MHIIQLWKQMDGISITEGVLKEITHDHRTKLMPKKMFINDRYKIDNDVFITYSSMIMQIANKVDNNIDALYYKHDKYHIVIVPSKSYIFYNGKPIEPNEFRLV